MIEIGMKSHVYKFENQIRLQSEGGPIGLALTGEVADCYMIDWDTKFVQELKKFNIDPKIFSRFKDDILLALKALESGTKLVGDKLIIDKKKK